MDARPGPVPVRLLRLLDPLAEAAGVVLAVSGGPDSTALMHLAAAWRAARSSLPMAVGCVDHGLRDGSAAEAETVVARARELGFPAERLVWSGEKPARGVPARARAARYRLLAGFAGRHGASHIVTAHTLDDQAETMLMRLVRGSGLTGLGGMRSPSRLGDLTLTRPLLGVAKADLLDLCRVRGWPFFDDPSNADPRYARSRWRALGPALAAEGVTAARIDRLGQRLERADRALDSVAAAAWQAVTLDADTLDFGRLAAMPDEIVLRVVRRHLLASSSHAAMRLERLEALCAALVAAHRSSRPLVRTLAGTLLSLDGRGHLAFAPESARRRGTRGLLQHKGGFPAPARAPASRSLGKGTPASYIGTVDAPAPEPDVVESHSVPDALHRGPMLSAGPQ